MDSLHKGYKSLIEYEDLSIKNEDDYQKSILLKDAILNTHHGIEILMKYILSAHNELLVFSNIDNDVQNAYKEKHQKCLNSIFESSNIDKVHTVSFSEAFERLKSICNHHFSKDFEEKIDLLNNYRNRLTHAEININDQDIILLFNNLLDELDMYLFTQIGDEYKTLSGYSDLIKYQDQFKDWLIKNGMLLKADVLSKLTDILKCLHINMGVNEVKRITDITVCHKLFCKLLSAGFELGTDFYNGVCSGDVTKIDRISESHLSIYEKDNNRKDIIKFKSLIIYNPNYSADFSPIFIIESNQDDDLTDIEEKVKIEECSRKGRYYVDGIQISTEKGMIYDPERLKKIYYDIENSNPDYKYHHVTKHLSRTIICMINIQGLNYGRFDDLISQCYNLDGETFAVKLRQSLHTRKKVQKDINQSSKS